MTIITDVRQKIFNQKMILNDKLNKAKPHKYWELGVAKYNKAKEKITIQLIVSCKFCSVN